MVTSLALVSSLGRLALAFAGVPGSRGHTLKASQQASPGEQAVFGSLKKTAGETEMA